MIILGGTDLLWTKQRNDNSFTAKSRESLYPTEFTIDHEYASFKGFAGTLTKKGYEKLKQTNTQIFLDTKKYARLDTSVPLINGTATHKLQINGTNLTGKYQSICVIDTGVDYRHDNLGNCSTSQFLAGNCQKTIAGFDFANTDNDPIDDNGHGTHVAGIAASDNTRVKGVAPEANIIAMKVLDAGGAGFTSDIIAAIDWCVNNATKFNISVITMSLGDGISHTSACDTASETQSVNAAVAAGIFVSAASGNDNFNNGIESPACISNVTSVGATDDNDNHASFSSSSSILDLLAPGVDINSTKQGLGFVEFQGTSMATPHVAGAAAILQQFNSAQFNKQIAPSKITSILRDTGKNITDPDNDLSFPRIDILKAIKALNTTNKTDEGKKPIVITLEADDNNIIEGTTDTDFDCIVDNATSPFTYFINFGDNTNDTQASSFNNQEFSHFYSDGTFIANCTVTDNNNLTNISNNIVVTIADDNVTPILTTVSVTQITNLSARIVYEASENINATINFGISPSNLNNSESEPKFDDDRSIPLFNLTNGTQYFFNIDFCDKPGNCNTSPILNFTTLQLFNDTVPIVTITSNVTSGVEPLHVLINCSIEQGNAPFEIAIGSANNTDPEEFETLIRVENTTNPSLIFETVLYNETTQFVCGVEDLDGDEVGDDGEVNVTVFVTQAVDTTPPAAITNLQSITITNTSITWAWDNPTDTDFNKTILFLDGVNTFNASKTQDITSFPGLQPNTTHTLTIQTVDTSGNINTTNVTNKTTTLPNPPDDKIPIASIQVNVTQGIAPLVVSTNCSTSDGDLPINYSITHDDGQTSVGAISIPQNAFSFTFTQSLNAGFYNVTCTIKDADGDTDTASTFVNVTEPMDTTPPGTISNLQSIAITNESITWNWTNPSDTDFNENIIYVDNVNLINISSTSITATQFTANSSHTLTIHTKDNTGNVNTIDVSNTSRTLENIVPPDAPIVTLSANVTQGFAPLSVAFNCSVQNAALPLDEISVFFDDNTEFSQQGPINVTSVIATNVYGNGTFNVYCNMRDNLSRTNVSNNITIIVNETINNPPTISSIQPSNTNVVITTSQVQEFGLTVNDIENGELFIRWFVNNTLVDSTSINNTYTFDPNNFTESNFVIKASVIDDQVSVSQEWNLTVTPIPIADTFDGNTTNFSEIPDLGNATDVTLEITTFGSISFTESLNLTEVSDLDSNVLIQGNLAAINTSLFPQLNRSARITLRGLSYQSTPQIFYTDGFTTDSSSINQLCDFCTLISFTPAPTSNGVVVFDVTHFTSFQVVQSSSGGSGSATGAPIVKKTKKDKLKLDRIHFNDEVIAAGQDLITSTEITNIGEKTTKTARLTVVIPELGLRRQAGPFKIRKNDDILEQVPLLIPKQVPPGEYLVRITVSSEKDRRVRHRYIRVI